MDSRVDYVYASDLKSVEDVSSIPSLVACNPVRTYITKVISRRIGVKCNLSRSGTESHVRLDGEDGQTSEETADNSH